MSNVVVSGYYGSRNAGDEAMLAAMLETFAGLDNEVEFTVISSNPADTAKRHGVEVIGWLDFMRIIKAIRKADLLISGGGSLLQNVTSGRSLYYYLGILFLGILLRTPVMLYAQGIGPVYGWLPRHLMRWLCNRVRLITVRDEGSLGELAQMGIDVPPIRATADSVLAINPVDKAIGRDILSSNHVALDKPIIGICVREWRNKLGYKKVIAEACDKINDTYGAQIVFIPMQYPEDAQAADKIVSLMQRPAIVLRAEYTTGELLSLTGNLELMLSVRLHSLIFAGVMSVPMIGVSYDPKIERFLSSVGEQVAGDLDSVTAEQILAQVEKKLANKDEFRKNNAQRMYALHEKALLNVKLALKIIHAEN